MLVIITPLRSVQHHKHRSYMQAHPTLQLFYFSSLLEVQEAGPEMYVAEGRAPQRPKGSRPLLSLLASVELPEEVRAADSLRAGMHARHNGASGGGPLLWTRAAEAPNLQPHLVRHALLCNPELLPTSTWCQRFDAMLTTNSCSPDRAATASRVALWSVKSCKREAESALSFVSIFVASGFQALSTVSKGSSRRGANGVAKSSSAQAHFTSFANESKGARCA